MLDACTVYKISTRGMLANTACLYTICSSPKHVEMKLSFIITTHQSFTDQKGRETVRKGGAGVGQEVGGAREIRIWTTAAAAAAVVVVVV